MTSEPRTEHGRAWLREEQVPAGQEAEVVHSGRQHRRVMIACDVFRAGTVGLMAIPGIPFAAMCVLLFSTVLTGVPFSSARTALTPTCCRAISSCSAQQSAISPTRPARSSASSPARASSPFSARTGRWVSTPRRSAYQLSLS